MNGFAIALRVGLVLVGWAVTLVATLHMAVFHLPFSAFESLLFIATAPTRLQLRKVWAGLFLWFVIMTLNQSLGLTWLIGYASIKNWAYSTPSGDSISALYFGTSALASLALVYRLRDRLHGLLS
ncbi:MAG TPA: hypothetical protein VJU61_01235 [Polyangiaceae bacterium]|nr:hypothetical protein [Polyangiaceae bacterium]